VGAIPEVINQRENGILIPLRDSKILEATIIELIEDKDKRATLGLSARKTIEDRFNIDVVSKSIKALYEMN
jgi:glycosyltransferase involved in cell wall biosynthesis